MRIVIYVLLGICAVLILVCYSMVVIADRVNRRAERMYRKWREQLKYDMENNGEPIDGDYNIGIDHAICVLGAMKGADDE
ncbi:MAG: hypothetical protein U0L88_10680 [Acutalibacteraceae bacterium]|nr:hypothetical protein [Acutalibacteraceae bacterium]